MDYRQEAEYWERMSNHEIAAVDEAVKRGWNNVIDIHAGKAEAFRFCSIRYRQLAESQENANRL